MEAQFKVAIVVGLLVSPLASSGYTINLAKGRLDPCQEMNVPQLSLIQWMRTTERKTHSFEHMGTILLKFVSINTI